MPIFLRRNVANPVPPATITSPDGLLSATAYPGGVFLVADFGVDSVRRVQFLRDGVPVRSGNLAQAPGGKGVAFDMEAPLAAACTWTAVPVQRGGTVGASTQGVALQTASVGADFDCWLIPVEQANMAAQFEMQAPDPETGFDGRNSLSTVQGSSLPAGSWDVATAQPVSFVFKTYTLAQFKALSAILQAGPLLWQGDPLFGIDQFVGLVNSIHTVYQVGAYDPRRLTTVELQPTPEPTSLDAPLVILGRSYDLVAAQVDSYDQLPDVYSSYDAMVVPQ